MLRHEFAVQLRDVAVAGRTLTILAAPFDTPAPVLDEDGNPIIEQFARGAFTHLLPHPHRVELRYEHRHAGAPYAVGQQLVEDAAGLVGTWRVAPSDDGDRLLGLVADDQLRGASVGFVPGDRPGDNQWIDNILTRRRVKQLPEVSLTAAPIYEAARVLELRAAPPADVADTRTRERERWYWRTLGV